MDEIELALLRRMTAEQKLAVMHSLWRAAWDLKSAGIRALHPDWPEDQVRTAVREAFRGAAA